MPASANTTQPAEDGSRNSERIVLRRVLSDERELVLIVGPSSKASNLAGILPPAFFAGKDDIFQLRLELRAKDALPLVLWSRTRAGRPEADFKGCDGLDAIVTPDAIVIALAEGMTIALWRIDVMKCTSSRFVVPNRLWQKNFAALLPFSHTDVTVRLQRRPDGSTVAIIEDLRTTPHSHTAFVQRGEEWVFVPAAN